MIIDQLVSRHLSLIANNFKSVWLGGSAWVVISEVALRRTRLVPEWVTVLQRHVNRVGEEPANQVYSAWLSLSG